MRKKNDSRRWTSRSPLSKTVEGERGSRPLGREGDGGRGEDERHEFSHFTPFAGVQPKKGKGWGDEATAGRDLEALRHREGAHQTQAGNPKRRVACNSAGNATKTTIEVKSQERRGGLMPPGSS